MGAFRAIAIGIRSFVVILCNGNVENPFRFLNLRADLREVRDLERGAVLLDNFHQVNTIEVEVVINHFKSFLGKVKSLFDQVTVCVLHAGLKFVVVCMKLKEALMDDQIYANVSELDLQM